MTSVLRRSPPPPPTARVGGLLRHWRSVRRLSQLELALRADSSSRHLSFVETGRAQPSRDLVMRLADALEMPLRERNGLLIAAGYAPVFAETELAAPDLELARRAVEFFLRQQEPYPAIVVNRHWNLVMANQGARRLLTFLLDGPPLDSNMLRLVFRPDGLRPFIANWEEVAGNMIRQLQQELAWAPDDETTKALLSQVLAYPDVPSSWRMPDAGAVTTPMFTVEFRKGDSQLRFFSTYTTFGAPLDITLAELRIESFFPADEATTMACRDLAVGVEPASETQAG